MFCPYPSLFDKFSRIKWIRSRSSANSWMPAGRRRFAFPLPAGLARAKACRKAISLTLAAAGFWVALGAGTFASVLPRTGDYDYDAPAPGTYRLSVVKAAADGAVLDSEGHALRLQELTRGRVTVLSFIYTRCASAKACPYATGVLNQLHRLSQNDPSLAKNMRLLSLSFDPDHDTAERMAAYASWAGGRSNAAEWRFLTTRSQSDLRPILDAYGQAVDRKQNPADPTGPLNHTLRVFVIDQGGNIRNIYSSATLDVRLVLADVKTLLMALPPASPPDRSSIGAAQIPKAD